MNQGFERGLERDVILADTAERYGKQWGYDKIISVPETAKIYEWNKKEYSLIKEVSCASIMAKVVRDYLMCGLDVLFPEYGFAKHKGYGTDFHRDVLKKIGPSPWHRMSFLKGVLKGTEFLR
jgi:ribonuclease HII